MCNTWINNQVQFITSQTHADMKANRVQNYYFKAIHSELQKRIDHYQTILAENSEKVDYFEGRLSHDEGFNDEASFRVNRISRNKKQIERFESNMLKIQQQMYKMQQCIEHLPKLKAYAKRLISTSALSYDFKEYYLPIYRQIYAGLRVPATVESKMLQTLLLPETVVVDLPGKGTERQVEGTR